MGKIGIVRLIKWCWTKGARTHTNHRNHIVKCIATIKIWSRFNTKFTGSSTKENDSSRMQNWSHFVFVFSFISNVMWATGILMKVKINDHCFCIHFNFCFFFFDVMIVVSYACLGLMIAHTHTNCRSHCKYFHSFFIFIFSFIKVNCFINLKRRVESTVCVFVGQTDAHFVMRVLPMSFMRAYCKTMTTIRATAMMMIL